MIVFDQSTIVINHLVQILVLNEKTVRCLLKDQTIEMNGSHFHVHSLSDHELILKGRVKAVQFHER